jgi:hypothetical protein
MGAFRVHPVDPPWLITEYPVYVKPLGGTGLSPRIEYPEGNGGEVPGAPGGPGGPAAPIVTGNVSVVAGVPPETLNR